MSQMQEIPKTVQTFSTLMRTPVEWMTVTKACANLAEEANLHFTKDGLKFRTMDPSHVALIDLFLPKSEFAEYTCLEDLKTNVNVDDFLSVISRARIKDGLSISKTVNDEITIGIKSDLEYSFSLKLKENSTSETPLPKLSFNTNVVLSQKFLYRIVDLAFRIDNHLRIVTSEKGIDFSTKGEIGSFAVTFPKSSSGIASLDTSKVSVAVFSLEYLSKILKNIKSSTDIVHLSYSSAIPLKMRFGIGLTGYIDFYLAPIATDEDKKAAEEAEKV